MDEKKDTSFPGVDLSNADFERIFGSDTAASDEQAVQISAPAEQAKPVTKSKPKPGYYHTARRPVTAAQGGKVSVLRNFPAALTRLAKIEFPDAKTNTDAIVAYMYCFCPELQDNQDLRSMFTVHQWDLIKHHDGGSYAQLSDRVLANKKKLDQLLVRTSVTEMLAAYVLYDRLGFRFEDIAHGANMDAVVSDDIERVLEDKGRFMEFIQAVERYLKEFKARKDAIEGRPDGF